MTVEAATVQGSARIGRPFASRRAGSGRWPRSSLLSRCGPRRLRSRPRTSLPCRTRSAATSSASGALGRPRPQNMRVVLDANMYRKPGRRRWRRPRSSTTSSVGPTRLFLMKARMFGLPVRALPRLPRGAGDVHTSGWRRGDHGRPRGEHQRRRDGDRAQRPVPHGAGGTGRLATGLDPGGRPNGRRDLHERARTESPRLCRSTSGRAGGLLVRRPSGEQQRKLRPDALVHSDRASYRDVGGMHLLHRGSAVYDHPDGPFTYGEFTMRSIEYDVTGPRPE